MPEIATSTRLDNDSEKLKRRREVNKIHAKKYYEKNREIILAKKKEYWKRKRLLKFNRIQ